jgi:hypothetical protein
MEDRLAALVQLQDARRAAGLGSIIQAGKSVARTRRIISLSKFMPVGDFAKGDERGYSSVSHADQGNRVPYLSAAESQVFAASPASGPEHCFAAM